MQVKNNSYDCEEGRKWLVELTLDDMETLSLIGDKIGGPPGGPRGKLIAMSDVARDQLRKYGYPGIGYEWKVTGAIYFDPSDKKEPR